MFDWNLLIQAFMEENSKINLSAIRDEEGIRIKHIQDSLELEKLIDRKSDLKIADIGTGGGFPLLPLAISHPECIFTGVDSIKKKTLAIQHIVDKIGIKNINLLRTRAEDIKNQDFDVITARSVAYTDKLLNWIYPLVKKHGLIALMKQQNDVEKNVLLQEIKKRKMELKSEHHYKLFDGDIDRVIYIIEK